MRILHFLNHTDAYNGHVNVAIDLACAQADLGHSVGIISRGGDFDEILALHGVEHIRIDLKRRPLTLIKAIYNLRRALKVFRPDIIHAHMMTSALLAFLLRASGRYRLVTTVHNEFETAAILMGLGDRVIAVSKEVAECMARKGIPRSKLRTVLNGTIGTPRLDIEPARKEVLRRPAITYVGGLHARKGIDDLIAAFKLTAERIQNAHLYLVGGGSGDPIEYYRDLAVKTGVGDRIIFCGQRKDPRTYLAGSDISVLASHAEPAGLVLVEARESGCAIIATSVGGIPEMLDGGEAGLLVPPKRPDLLAEAMINVLSDADLLSSLRRRARTNSGYFTTERAAKDYLSNYEELLNGAPSAQPAGLSNAL